MQETPRPDLGDEVASAAHGARAHCRSLSGPDSEDVYQEAALAALLAARAFDRRGLEEHGPTGRAGYLFLAAKRRAVGATVEEARRRAQTAALTPSSPAAAYVPRDFEAVERRAVVAAVLDEIRDVHGPLHAGVAMELLDHSSATHALAPRSRHGQVGMVAALLGTTRAVVEQVVDELVVYCRARRPVFLGA